MSWLGHEEIPEAVLPKFEHGFTIAGWVGYPLPIRLLWLWGRKKGIGSYYIDQFTGNHGALVHRIPQLTCPLWLAGCGVDGIESAEVLAFIGDVVCLCGTYSFFPSCL